MTQCRQTAQLGGSSLRDGRNTDREISHCFPSSDLLLMRSKEMEIIQRSGVNIYVY